MDGPGNPRGRPETREGLLKEIADLKARLAEAEKKAPKKEEEAKKPQEEQVKALQEIHRQLHSRLQEMDRDLALMKATLDSLTASARNAKNPPAEKIEGLIKAIDPSGLVKLTLGSDAGLQRGHTLEVFRLNAKDPKQNKYLGTIRVIEVSPNESVAQPLGKKLDAVKVGDKVASWLPGEEKEPKLPEPASADKPKPAPREPTEREKELLKQIEGLKFKLEEAEKKAKKHEEEVKKVHEALLEQHRRAELLLYTSQLARAQQAWKQDAGRAKELLESTKWDLRGWEWAYLKGLAEGKEANREGKLLKGHEDTVSSVVFSPDGQQVISGDRGGVIKVWEVATGKEKLSLKKQAGGVGKLAVSPDGRRLVAALGDKSVRVWDFGTGKEVLTFKGHTTRSAVWRSPRMASCWPRRARTNG